MIEPALEALALILEPSRIAWIAWGTVIGITVGLLPGLSGSTGMVILLPFVFGMDPHSGVALLIGMAAVVHTADTFPSVLLGVPGSAGSQATIVDGYPLAKQGKAAMALGAAFTASLFGGIFGAMVLFAVIPIARPLVLALGSPELFMLSILGISTVGVLVGSSALKGIVAGIFGVLIGLVGAAPGIASYRYTFGSLYLYDGIPLAPLALGLFAIPEMIDMLSSQRRIAGSTRMQGSIVEGMAAALRHRWLILRSAVLGSALGSIPGVGGTAIDWLAYGMTVQTSKGKSQFGKGDIRGVIGPEGANNAKEGGALIPTLLFGIPGSATTAILLGGLLLMGVQAGPSMVTTDLSVTLSIVWTLAFANVLAVMCCLALAGPISRISLIPPNVLMPLLLCLLVLASYQSTGSWGDVFVLFGAGVVGWLMKAADWPRAPIIIGFVLSFGAERYFRISVGRYGAEWLTRPGVIALALLIAVVVVVAVRLRAGQNVTPGMKATQQ